MAWFPNIPNTSISFALSYFFYHAGFSGISEVHAAGLLCAVLKPTRSEVLAKGRLLHTEFYPGLVLAELEHLCKSAKS